MTGAFTVVEPVMGTVASITVIGERTARVERAIAACVERLRDDERVFSTYRHDSDISRLRDEGLELGDVDPRVAAVAADCRDLRERSGGRFDAHWRGWFDPTGYVKGWSTDAAARAFDELLAEGAIEAVGVNVGGDMRLRTAPTSEHVWRIGIAHPTREGELLATVEVVDGAVATSGTSERGAHLVDPRTGVFLAGPVSATVIADDLTTADAWATVAAIAGIDDLDWMPVAPVASGIVWEHGRTRRFAGRVEVSAFYDALAG
ncbi:FAD:protein FMN transferase [uncultured Microbacterium sp.]|uniref:FAD:protein FMN transferase n=1 Tax=uncultured Microbacterium sp. TaxID=191216 RepID=UPI0025ECAD8F|nr:FAD:protein FMN transferase [uncultured Microbacterium sp.]